MQQLSDRLGKAKRLISEDREKEARLLLQESLEGYFSMSTRDLFQDVTEQFLTRVAGENYASQELSYLADMLDELAGTLEDDEHRRLLWAKMVGVLDLQEKNYQTLSLTQIGRKDLLKKALSAARILILLMLANLTFPALAMQTKDYLPLYGQDAIPNAKKSDVLEKSESGPDGIRRIEGVTQPAIRYYAPDPSRDKGTAIIVIPGGGYGILAIGHEGEQVAERLAAQGIHAFVLKYRLPNDQAMPDKSIAPLQDAQQAIRLVRRTADELGIDENRVGIMGFSAGGHLASSLGVHYRDQVIPGEKANLRPDFMMLLYPVISMQDSITHRGSRLNLLGEQPRAEQLSYFSNEAAVDANTPPTFLVHAEDDQAVPIANARVFQLALRKHGVPNRLLSYSKGGHGFGLNNATTSDKWLDHALTWLDYLHQPNLDLYQRDVFKQGRDSLPYRVLYPEHYDKDKQYPLLFVLHGAGERGRDNQKQLTHGTKRFLDPAFRNKHEAIIVFPQCPEDSYWSNVRIKADKNGKRTFNFRTGGRPTKAMRNLLGLLEQFRNSNQVDPEQVYIGGLSMGGMGTLECLRRKPEYFAAAFAICGGDRIENARKYQHVPLWIFHGEKDDIVSPDFSKHLVNELGRLGSEPRSTFYPNANHNSWDLAFAEPELFDWLFSH